MAYRGRGVGRGGFGRGYSKEEPFVPFPDVQLPDARVILSELDQKKKKGLKEEETLIMDTLKWLTKTEYYLDKTGRQDKDVDNPERLKQKAKRKVDSFAQYLVPSMFPKELTRGSNVRQVSRENVKWDKRNTEKSESYWNKIEKREQNLDVKKQKVGENDEEEDEDEEAKVDEEEDYDPSDDDYQQNVDFDDDEDEFNPDGGDDEPILDI